MNRFPEDKFLVSIKLGSSHGFLTLTFTKILDLCNQFQFSFTIRASDTWLDAQMAARVGETWLLERDNYECSFLDMWDNVGSL